MGGPPAMLRLALRMAPIAMLVGPVLVLDREHRESVYWLEWRAHTYEARSLAERIARDVTAGVDAGRLGSDIDRFARATLDNPSQVGIAEAIRAAARGGDLTLVGTLADRAIGEEDSLLPERAERATSSLTSARAWGAILFVAGCAVAVFQACLDWIVRRLGSPLDRLLAERDDRELALARESREKVEARNLANFLELKLRVLEDRLRADRFGTGWREVIEEIRAELGRGPDGPGEAAP